jgi:hypothetical protein
MLKRLVESKLRDSEVLFLFNTDWYTDKYFVRYDFLNCSVCVLLKWEYARHHTAGKRTTKAVRELTPKIAEQTSQIFFIARTNDRRTWPNIDQAP